MYNMWVTLYVCSIFNVDINTFFKVILHRHSTEAFETLAKKTMNNTSFLPRFRAK